MGYICSTTKTKRINNNGHLRENSGNDTALSIEESGTYQKMAEDGQREDGQGVLATFEELEKPSPEPSEIEPDWEEL